VKLATLKDGTRDGKLVVISSDNTRYLMATGIAENLQFALDHWDATEPKLQALSKTLNTDLKTGTPVTFEHLHSPLPRAYEWIDGSAFINHVVLVRKARGALPPETLETDPLVYQGGSGTFLAPYDDIPNFPKDWGIDFESEVCVVMGDTPMGTQKQDAAKHIRLFMICNDVTLRGLIPVELAKGFGFFHGKPSTAFGPIAVTPDELGESLIEGRVHLPLRTLYNNQLFGNPNAGPEMHFSFHDLIQHATKSRRLTAGTIIGSGTVSNKDPSVGSSCIVEKRMIEIIESGSPKTPFMTAGETVEIEMFDNSGTKSVFGRIKQKISEKSF
jgi:fumarylacetoacetate (FAA) hydrolase